MPGAEAMTTTRAMVLGSGLTARGVSEVGDELAAVDQSRMTATDATTVYLLRLRPPAGNAKFNAKVNVPMTATSAVADDDE